MTGLVSRLLFGRHVCQKELTRLLGVAGPVTITSGQQQELFLRVQNNTSLCEIQPGPVAVFTRGIGFSRELPNQIQQAIELGVKSIISPATGDYQEPLDRQLYYLLALAGFDAPLVQATDGVASSVLQVLGSSLGPSWWHHHGGPFRGSLDLTEASLARKIWPGLPGEFSAQDVMHHLLNFWNRARVFFTEKPPSGIGIILKIGGKETLLPPGNLGIPRTEMPQIDADDLPDLLRFFASRQVSWQEKSVAANTLRAAQKDVDPVRAMKMAQEMANKDLKKPVLVSQDHYLADGHHRWLGQYFLDRCGPVCVLEIALPIKELLASLHDFCNLGAGEEFSVNLVVADDCLAAQMAGWDQEVAAGRLTSCMRAALVSASMGVENFSFDRVRLDHGIRDFDGKKTTGNLWPRPAGRIRHHHADSPGGTEQSRKLLHFLRHRLRHRFSEDTLKEVTHLVGHLETDLEARHVYRSLVHGGHDPRNREEAAAMLHRCLIKLPRYDGPKMHKLHIGLRLDADPVGQDQVKALLTFYDANLVQDFIKTFQDAGKVALDFTRQPPTTRDPFIGGSQEQNLIQWRQVMTNARLLRNQLDTRIQEARVHLERMLVCQHPNQPFKLTSILGSSLSGLTRDNWGKAVIFVQKITSLRPDEHGIPLVRVLGQDRKYPRTEFRQRNSFSSGSSDADNIQEAKVFLSDYDGLCSCVHALGHVLEAFLPGARRAALEFLFYRTGKRFTGRTSFDLFAGGEALEGEQGREGGFHLGGTDAIYVGKVMPISLGTEVLAMGLQALWEDPAGLARGDQEFCRFVLGILRGDFRRG